MGDIADMMLDGTLCEGCGVYLGHSYGYPRRCPDCEPEKIQCRMCGKLVNRQGIIQHIQAKHAEHSRD